MDLQKSGNGPSTEIKKCPYYDPVTRATVKPGKICPEYNTLKGCPYAHPFEIDKWDGETPFGVPFVKPDFDPSLRPPDSTQLASNDTDRSNNVEGSSVDMEVDGRHTQPSTPIGGAVQRPESSIKQNKKAAFIPPSQDPSPAPPLALQREAVEQFVTNLAFAVQKHRIESISSTALAKFKADYNFLCQSYIEAEQGESPQDIMSPGEKAAWVYEREKMTKNLKEAESEKWAWIDGLVTMDGAHSSSHHFQIGDGEDAQMKDATSVVVPVVVLTEDEDMIVDALNHHRAKLHRGAISERVAQLRARMDRIRAFVERKEARRDLTRGSPSRPIADTDTEMRDNEHPPDLRTLFRIATNDLRRLEDLQEMAENMSSPIDVAEDWGTANVREEWFEQETRAAIEDITRDFIQQERERDAADANTIQESAVQGHAPRPMDMMKEMKQTLEELTTIRDTSENLLRIIGPVDVFEENTLPHFSFFLQNLSKASGTLEPELQTLLSPLSDRLVAQTMIPQTDVTEPTSLIRRTAEFHERHMNEHPSLQEARVAQLMSAHLPSQKEVQGHQRASWFSEYEELRELAGKIVGPIVERTNKQEDTLMGLERGRRASVEGGMHGEEGGLVSTHVSVEGAMG